MAWKVVAAVALVAAGALVAFATLYALGWRQDGNAGATPPARVITLGDGDVAVREAAATRCEASAEGGQPNLFCSGRGGTRPQVIFYEDCVVVWPATRSRTSEGVPITYARDAPGRCR